MVGSQARILYSDHRGRVAIAEAFNKAISEKRLMVSLFYFSFGGSPPLNNLRLMFFFSGLRGHKSGPPRCQWNRQVIQTLTAFYSAINIFVRRFFSVSLGHAVHVVTGRSNYLTVGLSFTLLGLKEIK